MSSSFPSTSQNELNVQQSCHLLRPREHSSNSRDFDGLVVSNLDLRREGFLLEELCETTTEEDWIQSEEGSDGGVDLIVLGEKR